MTSEVPPNPIVLPKFDNTIGAAMIGTWSTEYMVTQHWADVNGQETLFQPCMLSRLPVRISMKPDFLKAFWCYHCPDIHIFSAIYT